ncbi:CBN-UNC-51 protein [Aphelenchoides avenae]|nr:CBN-UNC-51 protein [Aphelenchus avenae]
MPNANSALDQYTLKIVDFGLAKKCDVEDKDALVPGTVACGTAEYRAPEILKGECNAKVDLWSIRIMLYECITGHLLFQRTRDAVQAFYAACTQRQQDKIVPEGCSTHLKDLLLSLLTVVNERLDLARYSSHPFFSDEGAKKKDLQAARLAFYNIIITHDPNNNPGEGESS